MYILCFYLRMPGAHVRNARPNNIAKETTTYNTILANNNANRERAGEEVHACRCADVKFTVHATKKGQNKIGIQPCV